MQKINNPVFDDLKKVGLIKVKRLKILQHNLRNGISPVFKDTYHKYIFLGKYLGIKNFIWLNRGIKGDDTHGHIDDISRFVSKNTIMT